MRYLVPCDPLESVLCLSVGTPTHSAVSSTSCAVVAVDDDVDAVACVVCTAVVSAVGISIADTSTGTSTSTGADTGIGADTGAGADTDTGADTGVGAGISSDRR